ncbi:ferritin-like domain-containing protein [Streptomyces sp. S.PNR 29]|uniref:ferritin-like domain-containing protein n=1 Tax=Streptomyces sp. S.PNR 29 TaxID=2973805 RepID=UPI0025B13EAA|nr:ferritin-like domain-containing protein [Streptomyces sp. S.PNR 29]MDN0201108.1 ferritin-like domain-containing protein [Streptomyces sp. S.PNR 29]
MDHADLTTIDVTVPVTFSWQQPTSTAPQLRALYEKAKRMQWDADTDIDWSYEINFGEPLPAMTSGSRSPLGGADGCPVPRPLWSDLHWAHHSWSVSQFLHGERGGLLGTARLVETVPDADAKLYAASQLADEARHVEVYGRYVEVLGDSFPISPPLRTMMENIVSESRWDIVYLGMQIIVEALALAIFRLEGKAPQNPVIGRITELVARDEARHVAFGVLALKDLYGELSSRERAEREEFVKESALLMARRFRMEEVWERLGVDVTAGITYTLNDPFMIQFRQAMFSKIVSNLGKIGMLTPGVRAHFEELQLLRTAAPRGDR